MKTWHATLMEHYSLPTTTLARAWLVVRQDGQRFGWTEYDEACTIDMVEYRPYGGLTTTAAHTTDSFAVDTLDVTVFLDVATEVEVEAGIWDNAEVTVFEYNTQAVPDVLDDRVHIVRYGNLGHVRRQQSSLMATINGIGQRLSTRIGRQYSALCPWRHAIWDGDTFVSSIQCDLNLACGKDGVPWIVDGTVTDQGEQPALTFKDTASEQPTDFFSEGFIALTSGANAGMVREVRRWVNQEFQLKRPFPFPVEVGDHYRAVIGDDHTQQTCKNTFDNLLHHCGFSFVPGIKSVYASPIST